MSSAERVIVREVDEMKEIGMLILIMMFSFLFGLFVGSFLSDFIDKNKEDK
jgi:hypothetical protein